MTCDVTTSIGAYLLGGLGYQEWSDIDRHLHDCEACRSEVVRLAGLPGLIARVPLDEFIGSDRHVEPLRPAGTVTRHPARWTRGLMTVGAVLVIAIAGSLAGFAMTRSGPPSSPSSSWSRTFALSGGNVATGVHGGASLTAESWGTEIWVQLQGVPPKVWCRLIVRSTNGRSVVGGTWSSGSKKAAWVPASAPFGPSAVASLQVVAPARTLVTLNRGPRQAR